MDTITEPRLSSSFDALTQNTVERDTDIPHSLKDLIIVPGHAAFKDSYTHPHSEDLSNEENWALLPYQQGETPYYIEHINKAIDLAAENPSALLVFSGSWTRPIAGQWSEAATYQKIAELEIEKRWPKNSKQYQDMVKRIQKDEGAFDSFQNLLGSVCVFKNSTKDNPENITVVGWGFKKDRFKLHLSALKFPPERFTYVGVNDPEDLEIAVQNEAKTYDAFKQNMYGVAGELGTKRAQRNWKKLSSNYSTLAPDLAQLIQYADDPSHTEVFPEEINWNRKSTPLPAEMYTGK